MNIYSKLTLLCLFLVVGSTTILSYFVNKKFEKTLRTEILSSVEIQATAAIEDIERFLYDRFNEVRVSARSNYIQIGAGDSEVLNQELQDLESLNDLFYSFSYYGMDRIKIGDSKRVNIGEEHSNSLYWTEISEENPMVMDIAKSESLDRVVLHFAAIVNDQFDDAPMGVLVGRVLIDELYTFLNSLAIGKNENRNFTVNLVDEDGVILYSNTNPKGVLNDKLADYENIISGQLQRVNTMESDDKLYFVANQQEYKDYSGNGWKLIISVNKSQIFTPLDDIQKSLFWVLIPVLLGAIVVALIAANLFVKPIVRLSKAADEMSRGNLDVDLDFKSKDEIGKLAQQLGKTSQILIKRIDEQRQLNLKLEDQKDEIAKQKEQLVETNTQLTDSISYAQRIQKSILPDLKNAKRELRDLLVFYQPKHIVSGDFYWFERVRRGRNDYLVIVCADCTGHGVPGAIMSIMGSNQLTNIVYYQNYLDPQKILARLDKAIKFELYAREGVESGKDGMEMGVCTINLEDFNLEFAGAGIPLYFIREEKLEVIKSIKEMVGAISGEEREVEAKLKSHKIELEKGDRFYLATDGFQDQFGGPEDRKFMGKNFRSLLTEYTGTPLKEQENLFRQKLVDWKGETEQTDDVLVMGFEV